MYEKKFLFSSKRRDISGMIVKILFRPPVKQKQWADYT